MRHKALIVKLHECADLLTGFPFKSADYAASGCRLLRGDNIVQGSLRWDGVKFLGFDLTAPEQYRVSTNDVVLAMDRPWIEAGLKVARIGPRDAGALLVQRVARLRAKPNVDASYLYCLLRSASFTDYILGIQTGTAVPHISRDQILSFRVSLPELSEQRAIGQLMSTIDDRISSLSLSRDALERIARAIYKSWFVDFDPVRAKADAREPEGMDAATAALFPSGFEKSSFPTGWTVNKLAKVSDVIYGAAFASKEFRTDGAGIPLIRIRDLKTMQPSITTSERHSKGFLVQPGDVVVGMDGEFRSYYWLGEPAWLNQRVCMFKPRASANRVFVRESLRPLLADVERGQVGTTVIHIGKTDIDRFEVLTAPQAIMDRFSGITEPLLARVVCNSETARTLRDLRDFLLPKLISGKLRIPDAEKIVEKIA